MGAVRGKDFKLYFGGEDPYDYDMPTWAEMTNVRDVTRNLERALADASTRLTQFRQQVGTLADLSIDFQMVYDPTDSIRNSIEQAFYDQENILIASLDGSINTVGSKGISFTAQVSKFGQAEALEDIGLDDVTIVVGYDPAHPPIRVHVVTPGTLTPS